MDDVVWVKWRTVDTPWVAEWVYFWICNASAHKNLAGFVKIQIEEALEMYEMCCTYTWELVDKPPKEYIMEDLKRYKARLQHDTDMIQYFESMLND